MRVLIVDRGIVSRKGKTHKKHFADGFLIVPTICYRNFKELLNICLMITQAEQFPSNKEILPIVCELAAHKEVYEVIEDLLGPIHHL